MFSKTPAPEQPSSSKRQILGGLFSIFGIGHKDPDPLMAQRLSERDEASLRKGLLSTSMPEQGSLLNPDADLKEFDEQRTRINKFLITLGPNPSKAGPIIKGVGDIDVVYLTPQEKGFLVNHLLPHAEKMELVQRVVLRITTSLFVDLISDHPRAKEFLAEIKPGLILRLGEIISAPGRKPADPIIGSSKKESLFDGAFIGQRGTGYISSTPLSKVPPVLPENGQLLGSLRSPLIYINGLNMTVASHHEDMQYIANQYGLPVVGIHNAKIGMLPREFDRGRKDVHNERGNPTINSVRDLVLDSIYKGNELYLVPVSHGANITSRAIQRVISLLRQDGFTGAEINASLKRVHIATFAGACWEYPDGPDYTHFVLMRDPVPFHFGLTQSALTPEEIARVTQFNKDNSNSFFAGVHTFRRAVAFKVKEPLINPGKDATIFVLDRTEPLSTEANPHSMESYVPRERKLVDSWFMTHLRGTGTEG